MAVFAVALELLPRSDVVVLHDAQKLSHSMAGVSLTSAAVAVELGREHALLVLGWQVLGELHLLRSDV